MIFLVDDDPIQNMLTSRLIETTAPEEEYKVFHNGEEALESIESGVKPNLILLDINMPIMDGWEFLEAYKDYKDQAKVFMLTSSANADDVARADTFDCIVSYFIKPINLQNIQAILKDHL